MRNLFFTLLMMTLTTFCINAQQTIFLVPATGQIFNDGNSIFLANSIYDADCCINLNYTNSGLMDHYYIPTYEYRIADLKLKVYSNYMDSDLLPRVYLNSDPARLIPASRLCKFKTELRHRGN